MPDQLEQKIEKIITNESQGLIPGLMRRKLVLVIATEVRKEMLIARIDQTKYCLFPRHEPDSIGALVLKSIMDSVGKDIIKELESELENLDK